MNVTSTEIQVIGQGKKKNMYNNPERHKMTRMVEPCLEIILRPENQVLMKKVLQAPCLLRKLVEAMQVEDRADAVEHQAEAKQKEREQSIKDALEAGLAETCWHTPLKSSHVW